MSEPASRLTIELHGDRVVVAGEIDAHTCPDLTAALDPLPGASDVRVDVSEVGFMDSSGLRTLISAHQDAESVSRRLIIENPSKSVSRLIEISGLAGHLHIVSSA